MHESLPAADPRPASKIDTIDTPNGFDAQSSNAEDQLSTTAQPKRYTPEQPMVLKESFGATKLTELLQQICGQARVLTTQGSVGGSAVGTSLVAADPYEDEGKFLRHI